MFWNFKQKKILSRIVIVLFAFAMLFPVSFLHAEFLRIPAPENLTAGIAFAEDDGSDIEICFNTDKYEGIYLNTQVKITNKVTFSFSVDPSNKIVYDIDPPLDSNYFEVNTKEIQVNTEGIKITKLKVCIKLTGKAMSLFYEGEYNVSVVAFRGPVVSAPATEEFTIAARDKKEDKGDLLEVLKTPTLTINGEGMNQQEKDLWEKNGTQRSFSFPNLWLGFQKTLVWKTFISPIISLLNNLFGLTQERAAPYPDSGVGGLQR